MASKRVRHSKLLDIVRGNRIESQGELSLRLRKEGVAVTQSTLSRDIRELGLVKIRGCYRVEGESSAPPTGEALRRAVGQFVVHTAVSGNMLVIRTSPGNAHSVGVVLDAARWPEVLGTVAGDDTVFVLLGGSRHGRAVLERIRAMTS
jgi:transcriptional regulator of arginine metabolism